MDFKVFDTSLLVEIQPGRYGITGGVLEGVDNTIVNLGWCGIVPIRQEMRGKYKMGEKVPDDSIAADAPPFGFAFQTQEQVDILIQSLRSIKSLMAEAGIPESVRVEDDTDECIYDEEEIYENCTVQVWRNSVTGEESIGWWKNDA